MKPLELARSKRLGPLFGTQFFGAFNDNLFKQAVVFLVVFQAGTNEGAATGLSSLVAGLFIVPFFLFSAFAGQISDKFDKSRVMRVLKLTEAGVMALGAVGFYGNSMPVLLATIFLMGAQSAFFGPAKFGILPQHLKEEENTVGNGLIAMSTFIAIVTGTILAGVMKGMAVLSWVGPLAIGVAALGAFCSFFIPKAPSSQPDMKIDFNLSKATKHLYDIARRVKSVHLSILGLSWFWFVGALVLTLATPYAKFVLGGTESLATAIIVTFVVGIFLGSVACIKLSKLEVELGLVPLGALGMTLFGLDLYLMDYQTPTGSPVGVWEFFVTATSWQNWRVIFDLTMVAVCAELYQIPLFALVQLRSEEHERSQVIAANNIFNALFMVASSLFGVLLASVMGLGTTEIFAVVFAINLAVGLTIFAVIPEFTMRFVAWILASTVYSIQYTNREAIPRKGAAVIVANHVSFIDWFILTATCRRPVRFVMYHKIFQIPGLNILFRLAKAIPIAPAKENAALKEKAFAEVSKALKDGQLVCIFPEGMITHDGKLCGFRPGV